MLQKKLLYKPAGVGFVIIVTSILTAIAGPLGSRIGWWDYAFAVSIFEWTAYVVVFGILSCVSGLIMARPGGKYRGFVYSLLGLIIGVPMIILLQSWNEAKQTLPPIQDISTNTENPPTFWYAPNARIFSDETGIDLQQQYYSDIRPLILPITANKTFDLAIEVIRNNGWTLWEPNRDEMHLEATEATFWFGFRDDVVIHITAIESGGSVLNMRSTSRFGGGGDGGTNANRIRSFFKDLKQLVRNSQ